MVRPTNDEKDLQNLSTIGDSSLRPEFISQLKCLQKKIFNKVKAKNINGHTLNGPMLIDLANTYIGALNGGSIPNIESSWKNVCTYEQERNYIECLDFYLKQGKQLSGTESFTTMLRDLKDQTITRFRDSFIGDSNE